MKNLTLTTIFNYIVDICFSCDFTMVILITYEMG